MSKQLLITGITGQDGSYLAELLLKKGYKEFMELKEELRFLTQRELIIFTKILILLKDNLY